MDIGKTDGVGGPGRIEGPSKITRVTPVSSSKEASSADKVELSLKAGMISKAMSLPQVRLDRVGEIKKLIAMGTFETDARLEGALKRFMVENPEL
jgi:negative regulator of flagellin synthesis FlgM